MFKRESKRLPKKFPSLKKELVELNAILEKKPDTGSKLTKGIYYARMVATTDSKHTIKTQKIVRAD